MAQGKGVLVLTGHFGNWEAATTAIIAQFPHMCGKFHLVRRALTPQWLDRLEQGDVIVFPFDQRARPADGIEVDFFGHPAWTFKTLAMIALATGVPVLPAATCREPDGRRMLRFEEVLPLIKCDNTDEAIRLNTLVYNWALGRLILRHPEQWYLDATALEARDGQLAAAREALTPRACTPLDNEGRLDFLPFDGGYNEQISWMGGPFTHSRVRLRREEIRGEHQPGEPSGSGATFATAC